ncbi:hypothetical protein RQP46_001500 [Phenoliferia psychrophenolica]
MDSGGEAELLVVELTSKLNQLRATKGEDLTTDLQRRLALLLQPHQAPSSDASSPIRSPPQTQPFEFGTSPPTTTHSDVLSETLIAALQREKSLQRENLELRAQFRAQSHRNDVWREELFELRRRCGISLEELTEMENADLDRSSGGGSLSPHRRTSRPDLFSSPSSNSSSNIIIPSSSSSPSSSFISPGRRGGGLADDDLLPQSPGDGDADADGGETPISISPGSRSGSGPRPKKGDATGGRDKADADVRLAARLAYASHTAASSQR